LLAVQFVSMHQDLETANTARDALASQVQRLGASPVAGPPGSRGEPGQSIVGPRGPSGPPGKAAPTITPKPGASGASGAPGRPGADSTVAGPSGPPGPSSTVAGPEGPAGPQGVQGEKGEPGSDGQPPAGWSYEWTGSDGVTHHVTCSRTSDSPDSAPQYECADSSTDEPSPSPSAPVDPQGALLLASAVLKRRRQDAGSGSRPRGRHRAPGAHR
jgi:hypothetical protein